jgi:small subunit ribosomal protein S6
MRDYEVVYIFKSSLTTEEIEARLEGYHARILTVDGSEITAVEHWGKRQLAYPIDRIDNGYYVVTQFTASPSVLPDFERVLKLDEDLLRHLVVLSEGELPSPSMYVADSDDDDARAKKNRHDDEKVVGVVSDDGDDDDRDDAGTKDDADDDDKNDVGAISDDGDDDDGKDVDADSDDGDDDDGKDVDADSDDRED